MEKEKNKEERGTTGLNGRRREGMVKGGMIGGNGGGEKEEGDIIV